MLRRAPLCIRGSQLFGIGGFELVLILVFGFLIFGPDRLPAIAKTVGQAIAKFRNAQEEVTKVVQNEIYDPSSDEPFKNPLDAIEKVGKQSTNKTVAKQESFSERKARYDREKAAKKAAEEAAAKESSPAAKPAPKSSGAAASKPAPKAAPKPAGSPAAKAAPKPAPKPAAASEPRPNAADLYKKKPSTGASEASKTEKGE